MKLPHLLTTLLLTSLSALANKEYTGGFLSPVFGLQRVLS